MEQQEKNIAFVTDNGETISAHFGRALYYEIVTLQNGKVVKRERREKAGHHSFGGDHRLEHNSGEHHHEHHGGDHDYKHEQMTAPIVDCSMLIARGMGMGAQEHLSAKGISVALTDLRTIDEAVAAYVAGNLQHNPRRLHVHGHGHNANS